MKPFITCCPDYHDFKWIQFAFKQAGFDVNYKEIGCFRSDLSGFDNHAVYHAVFFPEDEQMQEVTNLMSMYDDYKSNFFY